MLRPLHPRHSGCSKTGNIDALALLCLCRKNVDYLIATWHPDCHAQEWRESIIQGFTKTVWHGLTVIAETPGRHPDEAFVEFIARFTDADNAQITAMHERSRFLRIKEHWYYIDGIRPSLGRNDTCLCGSGKNTRNAVAVN